MDNVTVRAAGSRDLPALAALWHERMTLLLQFDRRFALAPDGREQWAEAAARWLATPECLIVVAESKADAALVGYAVGWIERAPLGLLPARMGCISDMHIAMHSYQNGLGRRLLDSLRTWFRQQGVESLVVRAARRLPVEQAFWRALGATEWVDVMWMKL
ncbi:MAG: GNAT family N-acetyltransferase [Aggregatilineales bacterium]